MNWSTWFRAERVTRSSFVSAPGAKAHTAEAQLPAYCRSEGRKETLSGRRLPSTGKNTNAAAMTRASQGGDMFHGAYPLQFGYPRNRKIVVYAKTTFHSSGTASGNVEMMNRWKPTINTTAASVSHLLVEKNSTSGAAISTVVPLTCAMKSASRDGSRLCGKSR